jgi:ribosomal protein S18 acetylase RimI-like enzyme
MAGAELMPGSAPFHGQHYVIHPGGAGKPVLALRPTTSADAAMLGAELGLMDPWARLGMSVEQMTGVLSASDGNKWCFSIWHGDACVGAIVVRHPWLAGPYLNLLGVLPRFQHAGVGRAAMAWLEAEALAVGGRSIFLCVSAFNTAAHAFYQRNGFADAALLGDLIKAGEDEILMRKLLR